MDRNRTAILVEIALSIALAAVLNTLKVFAMPQGGTVSLVMLPLFVVALRRGVLVGLIAGALYGCVDLMINPYVVYPVQVLLDYPVAYGAVGLAGLFNSGWSQRIAAGRVAAAIRVALVPGILFGAVMRYAAHVVSGVVFFGQFAPAGTPVLTYSLLYNSYVAVSAAACMVAAVVVMPALERVGSGSDERYGSGE
jgi:thiamine transporter